MSKKFFKHSLLLSIIFISILSFISCSAYTPDKETSKPSTTSDTPVVDNTTSNDNSKLSSDIKIHFINTGNSDAILIQGEKTLLIDGGDNNDESLISNYLKSNNISKLDYIIATHPHADHIGGLDNVISTIQVDKLLVANGSSESETYKDFINSAASKNLSPSVPLEGSEFTLGGDAKFKVFNSNGGSNANDQSLIVLVENGNDKLLFTGDAEEETETEVLSKLPDVDLLKVGHHGSKTSTSSAFLNKVNPEYAVITVGDSNKYNHPHKTTMDKLKEKNIKIHRTDECGDILFISTGNGLKTTCSEGSFNFRDTEKPSTSKNTNSTSKQESSIKKPSVVTDKPKPDTKPATKPVTKPQSKLVWLSATGSKYHAINNCGRMNPANARQVELNTLSGYAPCSKCF